MKFIHGFSIQYLIIGILCFLTINCASFPGTELTKYTYKEIDAHEPKPSIDYDFRINRIDEPMNSVFLKEITTVFNQANTFSKISASIGKEKYHLSFSLLVQRENMNFVLLKALLSGITLFIYPVNTKQNCILFVDVKKDGQLIKKYQYKNYFTVRAQLMQVFLIFYNSKYYFRETALREASDDMLLNFLHDLEQDKILN